MKWEVKTKEGWHREFAWLPIKIINTWIWLEFYDATEWYDTEFDRERRLRFPSIF